MSRYRTGEYLIDLDSREILRAGSAIDVEAKVFDLIALLLTNRDRALSKRELNTALWNDRPVTDAALSQQLRKARRVLGDDGNAQQVIRTVHGHGLRWVAAVAAEPCKSAVPTGLGVSTPVGDSDPPPLAKPGRARFLAVGALIALLAIALLGVGLFQRPPPPDVKSNAAALRIAVLPLDDQSGDGALAWTRSGLMGLMTSLLETRGPIEIVAAQNMQALDVAKRPLDAAAASNLRRALGATHLVETVLRRVGPLYELDLRLLAAGAAERHEVLHGNAPTPLAVEAVERIRHWLGAEMPAIGPNRGVANPFLAQAYARGLDAQLQGDHAGAIKYFDICLDQDPALAWPRLGLAVSQARTGDMARSLENATLVANAAREQGDDELLVAALRQLGSIAFQRGDLDGASAQLELALKDMSDNRPLALAELLVASASVEDERGNFAKSRAQFQRALQLTRDTGNRRGEAQVLINLASLENGVGYAANAAALLRTGLDVAQQAGDSSLTGHIMANLAATEANQGQLLSAIALLNQAVVNARQRGDLQLEMLSTIQLIWALIPFDRNADIDSLARRVAQAVEREGNGLWDAELRWALGARAARRSEWPLAYAELDRTQELYADKGMKRNLGPVLAEIIQVATTAGSAQRAHAAAAEFRLLATPDAQTWGAWLPLIDAQLLRVDGKDAEALDALTLSLDRTPEARGAAALASLFQLGRWQLGAERFEDLLAQTAWIPWMEQHPDAIAIRIAALRGVGRTADADAEQTRLDGLRSAPELDLRDLTGPVQSPDQD